MARLSIFYYFPAVLPLVSCSTSLSSPVFARTLSKIDETKHISIKKKKIHASVNILISTKIIKINGEIVLSPDCGVD